MDTIKQLNTLHTWRFGILVVASLIFCLLTLVPHAAHASIGYEINLEGWAWSSTIGWISMSSANTTGTTGASYEVTVLANGNLSGYAWSEHIGWIQFGGLSGFPGSGGNARLTSSGELRGWAQAVAGTDEDDGWDGWISLSCENTNCNSSNYGPEVDSITSARNFDGFAWGSTVVGWIDFSEVISLPPPDLVVSSLSSPTLDLNSFDVDELEYGEMQTELRLGNIGGRESGQPIPWEAELRQPDGTVAATDNGQSLDSLNINVNSGPITTTFSDISIGSEYEIEVTVNPQLQNGLEESDYTNNTRTSSSFDVEPPDPELTLNLTSSIIRQGEVAELTWGINNVYSMDCEIQGPGIAPDGSNRITFDPTVSQPDPTLTTDERFNASVYSFECSVDDPHGGQGWVYSIDEPERLEVLPAFQDI